MSNTKDDIGIRLKAKREERNVSGEKLSEYLGVPKDRIYKWEKGSSPKFDDRQRVEDWIQADDWNNFPREKETENSFKEENATYQQKRLAIKNGDNKKQVPVFGGYTTLGNIQVYDDEGIKSKVIANLPTDVFPGCDYAERASGDSTTHQQKLNRLVILLFFFIALFTG